MQRDKQFKQLLPNAPPQHYRHSNNGTEGGGVSSYLSRIQPGPGQAVQQDQKSQPQQSLPPGPMQMGYQTNPRGGQQYFQRPQQRIPNSTPRMGGVQQMPGTVFASLPSGNIYQQAPLVPNQGPPILLPTTIPYLSGRHHGQGSGQAVSNQQQGFYPLAHQYIQPQPMGPPPFPSYPVYLPQLRGGQFNNQNSTQNQVQQQQPTPQQQGVQSLYVEQGGGGQVTMSTMSGGPGGPNGTTHIMGPQAPNLQTLVQNPGAISSGAPMMSNPQPQKEKRPRKHAIPIIDPNSGETVDLEEEKDGVSHSADSSASHTPQPQVGKDHDDIKAKQVTSEFAIKVAELAFAAEPAPSAVAPPPTPSAPPHVEERMNGPVDHSHENEIVKESSPAPPPVAAPQLTAPQQPAPQPPAPQPSVAQLRPQQHPAPPAFVPTVSASAPSPLVELHRPSAPTAAVAKQLPSGPSGPPLLQASTAPASAPPPAAHAPAPVASPVPPPSTSPLPQAPSPAPVRAPSPTPQPSPAPVQAAPTPQPTAPVRKTQVMGPPAESAAPPAKKGGKKETGTGAVPGAGRPAPAGGRLGSVLTPPPAATTTVVGPPPAPAAVPKTPNFLELTNFKNFTPSSTLVRSQAAAAAAASAAAAAAAAASAAAAVAPAPAPAPVEEKSTNGEAETQVGKATQRPKNKKGGRMRGVDKGGSEMDAFVEPTATPAAAPPPARDPTPPPPREPTPPVAEPKARPVENSTAPVIELIQPEADAEETESVAEEDEGTDMKAMVAAKNEENAKVSAAAAAAAVNNNNNNITTEEVKEEGAEAVADGEPEEEEAIESMTIERSPAAGAQALVLRYNYKDGQWSPVNQDGKKVYDRDFLLEIKNSDLARRKPDFALDLDIFRDRPNDYNPPNHNRKNIHGSISMGSRGDNPSPPYRSSGSSSQRGQSVKVSRDRGPPRGGMGASLSSSGMRGMGGGKGGYVSVNSPWMREPEPILHRDPNGWKPTHRQPMSAIEISEEQKQIEKLQKKVRGILNKLTPQKFDTLVGKILKIPIDSESHLREMVNLVFVKAVDEPSFSKAYADLCQRLQKKVYEEDNGETNNAPLSFRKLLINNCQQGFEKNEKDELDITNRLKEIEETADPEKKKELKLLLDEEERKIRRKSVGLVRFLGELYKLHMLTPKIMHNCISSLLSQVAEEPLECLCKLLTTIGKELEVDSKKEFDEYFAQMTKLAQKTPHSKVSSRIRFMLQDVIELRQKAWKPRRDEINPKTIEQIHKDAERDVAMSMSGGMFNAPMHQGPKPRHPNERRNPRTDNDGWQTSGPKYRTSSNSYTNTTLEPSKLQHFKSGVAGDGNSISLGGPGYFLKWEGGASSKGMGGKSDSRSSGLSSSNHMTNSNRFAALSQADSDTRMKGPPMSDRGKGVSGSTSLEKDRRIVSMMRGDNDRDDMRRAGSGPSSRENSRPRYGQSGQSPAGSLNASRMDREPSRSEQPSSRSTSSYQSETREPTEARVPPATSVADLNEEQAKKNALTIFEEWCSNNNLKETMLTYNEWFVGQRNGCLFVRLVLEKVIEGKPRTCSKFGELLVFILKEGKTVTSKDVETEFKSMIDFGDDLVVDIPFFWVNMGLIFAPLISGEVFSFDELKAALANRPLRDRASVACEIFKTLKQNEKTSIWTSSSAKLTEFVPEGETDHFIKNNNLQFLAEPTEDWRAHSDNLVKILQADSDKALDEAHAFLAKIEDSVSKKAFIEIVTTAVIKASLKDGKLVVKQLTKFGKLILKYVDTTEELELICLFAIKNFVYKETVELSVLVESFKQLYDENIISEEAFMKWKDDTSIEPIDSEGRLLVTKALENFYVFLGETEDDDEEES